MKRAVSDAIRSALINRRPMLRCTWGAVHEAASKEAYAILKASGSKELNDWIKQFDLDVEAKDQLLAEQEAEIKRLEEEVKKAEEQVAAGTVRLLTAPEQDMYKEEILQIVRGALEDAIDRVPDDSRREHVLKAIVKAMPVSDEPRKKGTP